MCLFEGFLEDLYESLTGARCCGSNIVRRHSKKLQQLGDVSFPLMLQNWRQLIRSTQDDSTIFEYLSEKKDLEIHLHELVERSKKWRLQIEKCRVIQSDVHLFLNRTRAYKSCLKDVTKMKDSYGSAKKIFSRKLHVDIDNDIRLDAPQLGLSELRCAILRDVTSNLVDYLSIDGAEGEGRTKITLKSNEKARNVIVCGQVLNERGLKDAKTTASELYQKRTVDMQLMAQHKYGVRVKPLPAWNEYFEKLGKATVTIEMLQNRPHKSTKITLHDLQTANKGSSFIFYNCARLAALFKEFDHRVANKMYPDVPPLDDADLSLLNQPEEWELFYVYILQYPLIIKSCICDIEDGVINPHHLISFLSNLSSVFSVYYRRVKILTNSREHLLAVLHSRIYLLKALQQVFHTTLYLLNIEPVKEM